MGQRTRCDEEDHKVRVVLDTGPWNLMNRPSRRNPSKNRTSMIDLTKSPNVVARTHRLTPVVNPDHYTNPPTRLMWHST